MVPLVPSTETVVGVPRGGGDPVVETPDIDPTSNGAPLIMKITDVKAIYPKYEHVASSWRTRLWQIVVRVESDTGVVGYGYGGGGLAAVEVVNGHLRD